MTFPIQSEQSWSWASTTTEPGPNATTATTTGASWRTQDIAIYKVFPPRPTRPAALPPMCVRLDKENVNYGPIYHGKSIDNVEFLWSPKERRSLTSRRESGHVY